MLSIRSISLGLCATVLLWGCGGSELSLTEYVERLQAIFAGARLEAEELYASPEGAVLAVEGAQLSDFTPQDLQTALERIGEIEVEVLAAAAAIEPPEAVADLHELFFDDTYTIAREALVVRAGTATTWEELSDTPEMAAYRAAVARDKQVCIDIQAQLDATSERKEFADTPWIPNELKAVVEALLGCGGFPENPERMFVPPPTAP